MRNLLTLGAAALLAASCATTTPAPDFTGASGDKTWSELSRFIRDDMARNGITGLSIAVSTSKGTLWSAGFGRADPSSDRPFGTGTISNEGSVSKLVTATAVMKLVEQGLVDLDAPVTRYLPDLVPKSRLTGGRPMTVRDLMTHHSGLPSDYLQGFEPATVPPPGYPAAFEGNVASASSLYLATPPGQAFSYSNLAVSLLGVIVERVSGMPFEAFCQSRILVPLGMANSSFLLPPGFESDPRYARGPLKGKVRSIPYIRDLPAGALNSTALDMARFAGSYLAAYRGDPGILSQASVRQMFSPQNEGVEADVGFRIGLTFWVIPLDLLPGEFVVGHGGDIDPFHALVLLMPDRDLAVNIQVNSVDGIGSFTLADIAAQALRAAVMATGQEPVAPVAPRAAAVTPSAAEVARWTGTYSSALGVLRVRPQGQGVQVSLMGLWLDGVPRADGRIGLEARVLGLKLPLAFLETISLREQTVDDRPALALLLGGMAYGSAVRVEPEPVPEGWKARLGEYLVTAPTPGDIADQARLSVDADTGLLMFGVRAFGQWVSLPLHTVSETEAVTRGYGRNLGETLTAGGKTLAFGGLTFTRK